MTSDEPFCDDAGALVGDVAGLMIVPLDSVETSELFAEGAGAPPDGTAGWLSEKLVVPVENGMEALAVTPLETAEVALSGKEPLMKGGIAPAVWLNEEGAPPVHEPRQAAV